LRIITDGEYYAGVSTIHRNGGNMFIPAVPLVP
jgi:hypothetical protein